MKKLFVIGILVLIVVGICMENAGATCYVYKDPKVKIHKDYGEHAHKIGDHYNVIDRITGHNWHVKYDTKTGKWSASRKGGGPAQTGNSPADAISNAGGSKEAVGSTKAAQRRGAFSEYNPSGGSTSSSLIVAPLTDSFHPKPPLPTPYLMLTHTSVLAIVISLLILMALIPFIVYKNKKYIFRNATAGFFIVSIIIFFLISADAACLAKIGVKVGGISTNISAQLLENLTDIKAVVYDPYLGDLIFVGGRNYSLPKINVSDLVNALTIPKDQQKLSIELGENTCPVDYYGTRNTSFGLKLFNADYLLKNKTIDYISDCYCDAECVDPSGYRIWIEPSNISLKTANNAFVYDTVKISAYSEIDSATVLSAQSGIINNFSAKSFGTPFGIKINKEKSNATESESITTSSTSCGQSCWDNWASYVSNNFMSLANQYGEWNVYVSTAKIAAVANWIRDNGISYSWLIENYTLESVSTIDSVPTKYSATCSSTGLQIYGGASLYFNNNYVSDSNVEAIRIGALLSRPWDDEVTWNVEVGGKNYTAVALSLGILRHINYSIDFNTQYETPLYDVDYNAYISSIVPETLEISPGMSLNLENISIQGKDIMANVSLKLVSLNTTPIQQRNIISQTNFETLALWEPPVTKNTILQIPSDLKRGPYQIYAETYVNGTLQDIAVSDFIYHTPINGYNVFHNVTEYAYNVTDDLIIGNDCYADGNLSDCYIAINYVKRDGNDVGFSFNMTGPGEDSEIYVNDNLIGNLSLYAYNYTFVIPNLDINKSNAISIKTFDDEYEVYYWSNITIHPAGYCFTDNECLSNQFCNLTNNLCQNLTCTLPKGIAWNHTCVNCTTNRDCPTITQITR